MRYHPIIYSYPIQHPKKPRSIHKRPTPLAFNFPTRSSPYVPGKCGALSTIPISTPPKVPATGMVAIQERTKRPTRWKLTAFSVPLHSPTPTVAPVIHMEVETGRENCEKTSTVMAAPISMDEPREGEW
jgi:hypothetical protein